MQLCVHVILQFLIDMDYIIILLNEEKFLKNKISGTKSSSIPAIVSEPYLKAIRLPYRLKLFIN